MSYETYGFFRKEFLNDKKGKLIESDELFFNIYDFWVLKHGFLCVVNVGTIQKYKIRKNFKKKVEKSTCKSKNFTNN